MYKKIFKIQGRTQKEVQQSHKVMQQYCMIPVTLNLQSDLKFLTMLDIYIIFYYCIEVKS